MVGCCGLGSGRCHCLPDREGSRTQESVIHRSQQVASYSEKILGDSVEREKALGLASSFASAHVPFPLAGSLTQGFGAIVGVTFRGVSHLGWDPSHCGRVASEFVGNDAKRFLSLAISERSAATAPGWHIHHRVSA